MNLGMAGKAPVVTGSTAGIGLAVATALATEGASVVVNGRTPARVTAAIEQIRRVVKDGRVRWVAADLGTASGLEAFARACRTPASGFRVLAAISRTADGAHGDSVERVEWPRGGRTAPSGAARLR